MQQVNFDSNDVVFSISEKVKLYRNFQFQEAKRRAIGTGNSCIQNEQYFVLWFFFGFLYWIK